MKMFDLSGEVAVVIGDRRMERVLGDRALWHARRREEATLLQGDIQHGAARPITAINQLRRIRSRLHIKYRTRCTAYPNLAIGEHGLIYVVADADGQATDQLRIGGIA